jgi:hypothetical protein
MLLCLKDYRSGEKGVTAENRSRNGSSTQPAALNEGLGIKRDMECCLMGNKNLNIACAPPNWQNPPINSITPFPISKVKFNICIKNAPTLRFIQQV